MNYSAIKYCDIANGTGVRTVLFVSGCRNHCKDCFQPETWAFEYGNPFTGEVEDEIIASLKPDYIRGLTRSEEILLNQRIRRRCFRLCGE